MASLASLTFEEPEDWDPSNPPEQPQGVPLTDLGQVHTFGELKNYTFAPSERVGHLLQDGLLTLGANRHIAGHFGPAFRDLAQFTPLSILMGLADLKHYEEKGDFENAAWAAISAIPPGVRSLRVRRIKSGGE